MAQDSGAGPYRLPRNNIIHPLRHAVQYFYGLNNSIVHGNVRAILDSVVAALSLKPSRKFTCVLAVSLLSLFNILSMYVEQSYFARWWRLQPQHTRTLVRALVESGQLSFANGGWCMHAQRGHASLCGHDRPNDAGVCTRSGPELPSSALTLDAGTHSCISSWASCPLLAGKSTRSGTQQPTPLFTPPWALTLFLHET